MSLCLRCGSVCFSVVDIGTIRHTVSINDYIYKYLWQILCRTVNVFRFFIYFKTEKCKNADVVGDLHELDWVPVPFHKQFSLVDEFSRCVHVSDWLVHSGND
jgi:hypothetical protein